MQTQFVEKELGECLELVIDHRGKTPKKHGADWVESGIPTISAKNVNNGRLVNRDSIRHVSIDVYKRWMKEDVRRGDCFLVSEGATLGECMLWDEDYPIVLGQRIFCLRANPEILNPRFLYACMTSRGFQEEIIGRATGTSVEGLRQTEVLKLKIRLLPLKQQAKIGDLLYNINAKIELNRRMNVTLEAMARAFFQSWFVDFNPIRRNAEGGESRPEDALFPDSFEDSEMGEIPKGWKVRPLDKIADYQNGLALQKFRPAENEDPLPIVKIAQLKAGEPTWDEVASPSINPACIIDTGDVVFSWSGSLVVTLWSGGRAALNQHLFKVTSKKYPKWFYLNWTQKHLAGFQRIAEDKAVTMGHIKRSHLSEAMCVVPDDQALQEGTRRIAPLIEEMIALEEQSRTLATVRDTLLPRLLNGN